MSDDPDVKVEDIAKVGEEIEAYVLQVSDRDCMVRLSKKRLDVQKNWETVESAVESKEVLEGVITEQNKGGLVANVKGIRVFIPASQSGKPRGADLSDMVKTRCNCASRRSTALAAAWLVLSALWPPRPCRCRR